MSNELPQSQHVAANSLRVTDEEVVVRAQLGDLDAFGEIVSRFEGRLFNFIARRVGGRSRSTEAEDLTQETFLRAWRSIGDFQPSHRFSTWLFTIASRLVIDHLRHSSVRIDGAATLIEQARRRDERNDQPHLDDDRAAGSELWTIAAEILTHEQHAALWLRYAEDLSPAEVARVIDKNEVAVRVMLFRARQALATYVGGATPERPHHIGRERPAAMAGTIGARS